MIQANLFHFRYFENAVLYDEVQSYFLVLSKPAKSIFSTLWNTTLENVGSTISGLEGGDELAISHTASVDDGLHYFTYVLFYGFRFVNFNYYLYSELDNIEIS